MTSKTLTGTYASGYSFQAPLTDVTVAAAGYVGGNGLDATGNSGSYDIRNFGKIEGDKFGIQAPAALIVNGKNSNTTALIAGFYCGVRLTGASNVFNYGTILGAYGGVQPEGAVAELAGGSVTNGSNYDTVALITGPFGVEITNGAGKVQNFGTILSVEYFPSAVAFLGDGGSVTNGSSADTTALLKGGVGVAIYNAAGVVTNFGAIEGAAQGVFLDSGGSVTNGTLIDTGALIQGGSGVFHDGAGVVVRGAAGTVTNFGAIESTQAQADAVLLADGGSLVNGAGGDRGALVEGYYHGVTVSGAAGSITNFGTIEGRSSSGVSLVAGGAVTNGDFADTSAVIEGLTGIDLGAAGAVVNFGAIDGENGYGVVLRGAATLTNGSGVDRGALIEGSIGVELKTGGAVANFGTIKGLAAGTNPGAYLNTGAVTNGTITDTVALIEGSNGLTLEGATATNFGAVVGQGAAGTQAALLGSGSSLTNRAGALVEGYAGVVVTGAGTVTNFGTIDGLGGTAVRLGAASETLVVEAGSTFTGKVLGAGGALDLASGKGGLSGLFTAAGVTVSGSMSPTTFQAFNTVEVAAGASFTAAGPMTIAAGDKLVDYGSLTLSGPIINAGMLVAASSTLTVTGAVTGTGRGVVNAGTLKFTSTASFNQTVAFVGGGATLELAHGQTYSGSISGFSTTGTTRLDLDDIAFIAGKTKATYAGTTAAGILTVTDGTHTAHIHFSGNYTSSAWTVSSDGHGGTRIVDPTKSAAHLASPILPTHGFIQAMAGMGAKTAASIGLTCDLWRSPSLTLTGPRAHTA